MLKSIHSFNHALEKANSWLKELKEDGNFTSEEQALTALRAVLHTLRDRLMPTEAVHLGAQLPMLIRGIYYDGFVLTQPNQERTAEEFIYTVKEHLSNASSTIDAESATQRIFDFLQKKISAGEIKHVEAMLPEAIRALWQTDEANHDQSR